MLKAVIVEQILDNKNINSKFNIYYKQILIDVCSIKLSSGEYQYYKDKDKLEYIFKLWIGKYLGVILNIDDEYGIINEKVLEK